MEEGSGERGRSQCCFVAVEPAGEPDLDELRSPLLAAPFYLGLPFT